MKEFWCGAVVPNCSKRLRAANERELSEPTRDEHGVNDVPVEVVAKLRAQVEEVADSAGR
jgi:predicted small metal-binding protein